MRDRFFIIDALRATLFGASPRAVIILARGATLVLGFVAIACYRSGNVDDGSVILLSLALGMAVLSAYPRHRATDLIAAVAIWISAVDAISSYRFGHVDLRRWLIALATLGLILLLRSIYDFRALARQSPLRPMARSERRGRGDRSHDRTGQVEIDGSCRIIQG